VTELCAAAAHGFFARVRLLVDHDVDVNARSPRTGRTAYEEAVRAGYLTVAEFLVQRGATKIELDPLETFALACIAGRGAEARARLAAEPTLLERLGHHGRMDMAASRRRCPSIRRRPAHRRARRRRQRNGARERSGPDRSPQCRRMGRRGHGEAPRRARRRSWRPRSRSRRDAARLGANGQREVADYLLASASVFDAVRAGGVERVAALIREDPSLVRARDHAGRPLAFLLDPDDPRVEEMIRLLVESGVDLNARDGSGRSAVDAALARGLTDFAAVLQAHGASG
jgi:hypothetical protein